MHHINWLAVALWSIPACAALLAFVVGRARRATRALRAREERYHAQRDALASLAAHDAPDLGELDAALRRITELDAHTLNVERVSIWRFTTGRDGVECVDLYERTPHRHSAGFRLARDDYPAYFEALSQWTVIAADDAHRDPRTAQFSTSYLTPLGIGAMLDTAIHVGGIVDGVLCREHVGPARRWTEDEKTFGVAVANLVSLALEGAARMRMEGELRLQGSALNAAADAIAIADTHGAVVWRNPAFEAQTGYAADAAAVVNLQQLVAPDAHDPAFFSVLWAAVRAGNVWRGELTIRRHDGTLYPAEQTITPVRDAAGTVTHFTVIQRDLSERRQLEERVLQAQRLETVGRLAGGIAHDFNNLLTVINGTADLGLAGLEAGAPLRDDLQQIREAGERAAALTRQLLAFSRNQILKADVLSVNDLVTGLRDMLRRLIGEDLELVVRLAAGAGSVRADARQMEQVILNLAINARDAMPDGGVLTIETHAVEFHETDADRPPNLQPGPHVMLTVTDSGFGMDEETRLQIFDPFFTTKDADHGTGLGLATVHGIIHQSGGAIWVDSTPAFGTTFRIWLPVVDAAAPPPAPSLVSRTVPGTETILVVDDEAALRLLAVRILQRAGYTVLTAADGSAALDLLERHTDRLDLMLTDVVMPGMSGRELATRATALRPDLKVLFTSGYTDDAILRHGVLDHAATFIGKPYSITDLTASVRALLDETVPPALVGC